MPSVQWPLTCFLALAFSVSCVAFAKSKVGSQASGAGSGHPSCLPPSLPSSLLTRTYVHRLCHCLAHVYWALLCFLLWAWHWACKGEPPLEVTRGIGARERVLE